MAILLRIMAPEEALWAVVSYVVDWCDSIMLFARLSKLLYGSFEAELAIRF